MEGLKSNFLVVGILTSKTNGKHYATGRFWNETKHSWNGSRRGDGTWGDALIEIDEPTLKKLDARLGEGLVVLAEVSGYNGQFPVWSITFK